VRLERVNDVSGISLIPFVCSVVECVFRSMWAGDSIRCGHLILFDVGSYSVVMWAAFAVLP
jgi:hypothetical protein